MFVLIHVLVAAAIGLAQSRLPAPVARFFTDELLLAPVYVREFNIREGEHLGEMPPCLVGYVEVPDAHGPHRPAWVVVYQLGYLSGNASEPALRASVIDESGDLIGRFEDGDAGQQLQMIGKDRVGFVRWARRESILCVCTIEPSPRKTYEFHASYGPDVSLTIHFVRIDTVAPVALIERTIRDYDKMTARREYQECAYDPETGGWMYGLPIRKRTFRQMITSAKDETVFDIGAGPAEPGVESNLRWDESE